MSDHLWHLWRAPGKMLSLLRKLIGELGLFLVTAQFKITDFSRFRFSMVRVLSIVWRLSLLLYSFHKKQRIWEKSFGFCQTDNPQFSFIMYCYTYRQLTCRNLEVNSVSYVSQQRGNPWLSALEIFHNNSCFNLLIWTPKGRVSTILHTQARLSQVVILIVVTLVSHHQNTTTRL